MLGKPRDVQPGHYPLMTVQASCRMVGFLLVVVVQVHIIGRDHALTPRKTETALRKSYSQAGLAVVACTLIPRNSRKILKISSSLQSGCVVKNTICGVASKNLL